ncbi:MAG: 6-phosphofructokinase [Chloroflexi bacterium]|nr:6-phosphofructokinase [Chloroflexota bacterium]MBI4267732.1 6-phosphofructokinase [Chloroflexota bacterium]
MAIQKRIGILTGGGDCPGLNAAIRATAKAALKIGYEVIGFRDGWDGMLFNKSEILDKVKVSGIIDRGGTILGASRTSPLRVENGTQRVFDALKETGLEAVVVLGGEGTLTVSSRLFEMGLPVIGIPKTIDNDIPETDYSIGFQTAVQTVTDALDRLRSTAESHHRVMILEVMGRHTGWIATFAGMANGAEAILIPEIPMNQENIEKLCQMLDARYKKGIRFSIIVIAEGVELEGKTIFKSNLVTGDTDPDRLGGVGQALGELIERKTGLHTNITSLGYVQRGGTPVAYDRSLATAFGVKAVQLIIEKRFGQMTSLKGNRITSVPLQKVAGGIKTVDLHMYRNAEIFFG